MILWTPHMPGISFQVGYVPYSILLDSRVRGNDVIGSRE